MTEETKDIDLAEQYAAEYKKLVENLEKVVAETPACYFTQQSNDKTIIFEVRKTLAVSKTYKITVNPETGDSSLEEIYAGNFAPKNTSLVLSINAEDSAKLFNQIQDKLKSYTQESYAKEQNAVVVNLIEQVNKQFADSETVDAYFTKE